LLNLDAAGSVWMAVRACQTEKLASWSPADAADRRTTVGMFDMDEDFFAS
jgi:hypothetical protein